MNEMPTTTLSPNLCRYSRDACKIQPASLRTPKLELFDDGPCHLFCGGFSPHVRGRGFPLAQNLARGPVNVCADLRQADKLLHQNRRTEQRDGIRDPLA